jgi:GSH-dependent disulfide-bond oxidoreductase
MSRAMIDLYTYQTSNGQRAAIMLEECGFPYRVHKIDLFKGEQQHPDYLAKNPVGAIPTIVDDDGPGGRPLTLTQSGAIALYLAEKAGRFVPADPLRRIAAMQWLMYGMTDCAPASANLFLLGVRAPEKSEQNLAWLTERMLRYFRVVDRRLADREYLADELSVADFSLYPVYAVRKAKIDEADGDLPNLARWGAGLAARPGVAKGMGAAD